MGIPIQIIQIKTNPEVVTSDSNFSSEKATSVGHLLNQRYVGLSCPLCTHTYNSKLQTTQADN